MVRAQTVVAGLIALAVLMTACGRSGDTDQLVDAPVAQPQQAVLTSPLEDQLGFASEPGRRQYQLLQQQLQADERVVQCMRQAGFFYAVGSAQERFQTGAFVGDESREFAAASGLGITSSFTTALAADTGATSPDAAASNLDYVASLTAEQAADYDQALVGQPTQVQGSAFEPAGCWGDSFTEILTLLAVVAEFEPELEAMNARLIADPRYRSMQQDWSGCMTTAGFRYDDERAMVDDVYAQLLDIELVEVGGVTRVATAEELDRLVAFEQQVAVASFDCRQGFATELTKLRVDYEREFLDDNRFRIAELPGYEGP